MSIYQPKGNSRLVALFVELRIRKTQSSLSSNAAEVIEETISLCDTFDDFAYAGHWLKELVVGTGWGTYYCLKNGITHITTLPEVLYALELLAFTKRFGLGDELGKKLLKQAIPLMQNDPTIIPELLEEFGYI